MPDALELLAEQHREVTSLFTQMGETAAPKKRRTILDRIVKALTQHAAIEEEVFYPTVAKRVVDGDGFITVSREEHEKAKTQLHKLDGLEPDDPLFAPSVGELIHEVKVHVGDEETQLFPRVRSAFSAAELSELGARMAKRTAKTPARPHPKAPSKPPRNVAANRAAARLDRARPRRTSV
jgi:hemerythrin superfamily protein